MSGKILVVDDDTQVREFLETLLIFKGYEVYTAADGLEGLDCFWRFRPDVVVSDVEMPNLDGFQLCRELKSHPETRLVPFILVTGLSAKEDRVRGIEAGADDFLQKPIDSSEFLARVASSHKLKTFTDELEHAETVLFALARSIEGKDPYTLGHCERLGEYSAKLGQSLRLNEANQLALNRAAIVHDIGKVAVPDAILLKPTHLTAEEYRIMQQHPVTGERICAPLKSFHLVLPIIRHHHEKLDGSGYPDGLSGDAIPLTARILQIVDVYDALTTQRPYKSALSHLEAVEIMREEVKKGWWDGQIFEEFSALLSTTSPGSEPFGSSSLEGEIEKLIDAGGNGAPEFRSHQK